MKNEILNRDDFIGANEVNGREVEAFLLKENERTKDLLPEVRKMHEVLAKSFRRSKIRKESNVEFSYTSSDFMEE